MLTARLPGIAAMEFHVARDARDRYRFDDSLYSITGNVILANFHAARVFAQRMNQKRDLVNYPEQSVKASQINAMGLIHELTHYMFRAYREQNNPQLLTQTLGWLNEKLGADAVDAALMRFAVEFPALTVYRRERNAEEYLAGETDGIPNREIALEEMLMLWLENMNPAFSPFQELFDDSRLEKETTYPSMISSMYTYFGSPGSAGADGTSAGGAGAAGGMAALFGGQNVIDILR